MSFPKETKLFMELLYHGTDMRTSSSKREQYHILQKKVVDN
ncbi:hypothetical protein GS8_3414 [Geobacillus stearothermophilus]|uniref:Uncharacterized protein n=1 Tax=Geobacillus stearothermophilus TaxID=1422 RepID=A0A150MCL2_GEOSE|nr:hypothetical protein GS8_3414 [Geobacillus stearothermophilus]KYD22213.1 hypothetical protein B4109_0228 [Geobacillus stearothermophilus]